jgi:hypothetical protein
METWRLDNAWVEDSALFDVLRQLPENVGKSWSEWPKVRPAVPVCPWGGGGAGAEGS